MRRHAVRMLCDAYIEAVLVDEELADLIWEAWYAGDLSDWAARVAWFSVATTSSSRH